MKNKFIFSVLLLLASILSVQSAFSQTKGTIAGKIVDKQTGEELIAVAVGVKGTSSGAQTDLEGRYTLSLLPGTYTLQFVYIGYNTVEMANIEVKAGESKTINVALEESVNQLEEVVVQAEAVKESASFVLLERKNAAVVSDGISADLIKKTPDRTTSDVLKRVTGASIQDGKFAIIRGMSDRYNAGYLNGAPLPSTESDRKAFSFDVIPANLVDNIQVIKAGSPDLIGDFGGGIIMINTKNIPEVSSHNISIGAQYHSLTTFKEFKSYKGSSTDFLGLTGQSRALPQFNGSMKEGEATPAQLIEGSKLFNNDWTVNSVNAAPNFRFNYSGGAPFKLFGKEFGVLAALNYYNNLKLTPVTTSSFTPADGILENRYEDNRYERNTSIGGLLNLSGKINQNHLLSFRNFINVNTFYNFNSRSGIFDGSQGAYRNGIWFTDQTNYGYLYSGQLAGDHNFGPKFFKMKWVFNSGFINRQQPDNRVAFYSDYVDPDGISSKNLVLDGNPNRASGRFFSSLDEDIQSFTLNLAKQLDIGTVKNEIKAGGFYQVRSRSLRTNFFTLNGNDNPQITTLDPSNDLSQNVINTGQRFYIDATFDNRDRYRAKSNLGAVYLMVDNKFFNRLRAVWGVRYESYYQEIVSSGNKFDLRRLSTTVGNFLPSVNLTYSVTEKSNIRAAGYMTVNRPEFRELAKFPYYNPVMLVEIRGNDTLRQSTIYNAELRFEHFPTGGQVLSAGVFYKYIQNPIEMNIDATATPILTFYYGNEKAAYNYGVELEARKNFDFIGNSFAPKIFNNLVIYANLALITSRIILNEGSPSNQNRPLQGQSPYVINAGLNYDNQDLGLSASVAYNYVGPRVYSVGTTSFAFGADMYENPRHVIDMQLGKSFGKFEAKVTVGDILAQNLIFFQDQEKNGIYDKDKDFTIFNYRMGSTVALGLSYRF